MADQFSVHFSLGRRRRVQLRIECVPQHPGKLLVEAKPRDGHRVDVRIIGHENLRIECDVDQASDSPEGTPTVHDCDGQIVNGSYDFCPRMLDAHCSYFSDAAQTRPPSFASAGLS